MKFQPVNRHIWVQIDEKQKEESESGILLPEDYRALDSPHAVCEVLESANDCDLFLDVGDKIIVDRSMISNIEYEGMFYSIILENYVYGILDLD